MEEKENWSELALSKITFDFTQRGNTLGTTEEYERLLIEVESQVGDISDGPFFVLRTEGWSIDSIEELNDILEKVKKSIKKFDDDFKNKKLNFDEYKSRS